MGDLNGTEGSREMEGMLEGMLEGGARKRIITEL